MTTSSNNWMLIKIIKLFGALVPLEPRLGKKLLEPLTNLINSTSAMSLLYECINTVIAVLISTSAGTPGDHTTSIQLCVQKLGLLIEDSDQNLKYLGLLAMGKILQTHPKAVQAHKDIVLRCLDDRDESIRIRSLDLLYGMVSKKNIMEIVKKLMEHVEHAEGSHYRDELLSRIISICSYNNYQYITNFEWYISVLVELTKVEGTKHGAKIAEQIQDVTVRVQSIRHFSVSQMALLACTLAAMLRVLEQYHSRKEKVGAEVCQLYEGELNPVAGKAQRKVPLPEGLDLDVWIGEEWQESASESSDEDEAEKTFGQMRVRSEFANFGGPPRYESDEEAEPAHQKKPKKKASTELTPAELEKRKLQREREIQSNPYYVKGTATQPKRPTEFQMAPKAEENGTTSAHLNIQSPLEIPGVVGLSRYMEQQDATLTWKKAKKEKKKTTKKGKKKRHDTTSDEDEAAVVHQVNRHDGEMPENAKSTDDEAEEKTNGLTDEFKALDVNLDEPLRPDEIVRGPQAYIRQTVSHRPLMQGPLQPRPPTTGPLLKKPAVETKKKKKKTEKDAEEKPKKKKKAKTPGATATNGEPVAPEATNDIDTWLDTETVVEQAADALKEYSVGVCPDEPSVCVVTVALVNEGSLEVKRVEMNVCDTLNARLKTQGAEDGISVPTIPPGGTASVHLRLSIASPSVSQKIRGSLTYFVQEGENSSSEKLDFKLAIPTTTFLSPATIGKRWPATWIRTILRLVLRPPVKHSQDIANKEVQIGDALDVFAANFTTTYEEVQPGAKDFVDAVNILTSTFGTTGNDSDKLVADAAQAVVDARCFYSNKDEPWKCVATPTTAAPAY
ncbi:unnamed protein product, partial [Mesorhabditis spiculigera]